MKKKSLLVVARKFNDIYYALSMPDWNTYNHKVLIIITNKLLQEDYPMQNYFNKVYCLKETKGIRSIIWLLIRLKIILSRLAFDTVSISNIAIVANKFIVSQNKCKNVILLEDGLMNYYNFKSSTAKNKLLLMKLLGVSDKNIEQKIVKTYLLEPDAAKFYYGDKVKLDLNSSLFLKNLYLDIDLNGKKIFIGQPLYLSYVGLSLTVETYCQRVNEIIKKYKIDYYVPHTMSDKNETIDCMILDTSQTKTTFEVIASIFSPQFYSISSSVLYTTKIINPKIKSIMVRIPEVPKVSNDSILYKYIDNIISLTE